MESPEAATPRTERGRALEIVAGELGALIELLEPVAKLAKVLLHDDVKDERICILALDLHQRQLGRLQNLLEEIAYKDS